MAMTEDELLRWKACVKPVPLESHNTPVDGCPLENISDEALLTCPPHLIAHVQRTAAQGGFQVISPRQVPFSQLMLRTSQPRRQLGDHIVGSIADPTDEWPTMDNANLSGLLPDEPLPPASATKVLRAKTRTAPLTTATHELADPILMCLVKGRAVVDMLRRDDVQGGADEYVEVLAKAWGVGKEDIEDMDAFTLGIDGPLLRHAIKADEVYPTVYAPIQVKRCVSVGASEATRHYLPMDSAIDWRRMRVFAEAVFTMSCSVEGVPIKYMACHPPPGDAGAPGNRANVMCFQPAPASAWTFDPVTFSILPDAPPPGMKTSAIPQEVLAALARHVRTVKPMSYVVSRGFIAAAKRSTMMEVDMPPEETITSGYSVMVKNMALGTARGKKAANAVRNLIYSTIEAAPLHTRLRIARYIYIAGEECRTHLKIDEVPDGMIVSLAKRFLTIGDTIRHRVSEEANKRGANTEEWWVDLVAQAPDRYKAMVEGTMGWACVSMWLLFREPTKKWRSLAKSVHYSALTEAEVSSIGAMSLPAAVGSVERVSAACRAAVKGIANAYCGFYKGVADVGVAIADEADRLGRTRTADILREAAYLWVLRARAFRGTNVEVLPCGANVRSPNHIFVPARPNNLAVVPAPYKAYTAYKTHMLRSEVIHMSFKRHIETAHETRISDVFRKWPDPIATAKETTLTRYLISPARLCTDMEEAWNQLAGDVRMVAERYGAPETQEAPAPKKAKVIAVETLAIPVAADRGPGISYWDMLADLDPDTTEWIDNLFERLGSGYEDMFAEMMYDSVEDFMSQIVALDRENPMDVDKSRESVH